MGLSVNINSETLRGHVTKYSMKYLIARLGTPLSAFKHGSYNYTSVKTSLENNAFPVLFL